MNIEQDLFQVLTLALLLVTLIALLATLATLSGIKKSLSEGTRSGSATESAYSPPASSYGEPQSYSEPQPSYSGGGYTGGYGAEQASAAPATQEVATGYVPLSQAAPAQATAQPAAASSGLTGTEPEEQPFERDGRWWFKRGNELLVYDEGTGQWVAAGQQAAAASTTPAATTTSFPTSGGDAGEGWKCASCGAINGSTATVCRMCFTPR